MKKYVIKNSEDKNGNYCFYYKYMNTYIIKRGNYYRIILHYSKDEVFPMSLREAKEMIDFDFRNWIVACLLNDEKTGIHKTTHQITKEYKQGICEL